MAKVTNEQGGTQSYIAADFDCIPPEVLKLLAECLGRGARIYGKENWKKIPLSDNLNHAMNHINEWRRGDRSEPHLVNVMARITFALWQAVDSGQQPDTYIHPEDSFHHEPITYCAAVLNNETGRYIEIDPVTKQPTGKQYINDGNGNKIYIANIPTPEEIAETMKHMTYEQLLKVTSILNNEKINY